MGIDASGVRAETRVSVGVSFSTSSFCRGFTSVTGLHRTSRETTDSFSSGDRSANFPLPGALPHSDSRSFGRAVSARNGDASVT